MTASQDRRSVHAYYDDMQIVRYDRAGKWYLEPTLLGLRRQPGTIDQAVEAALWGHANANGVITLGKPGGGAFDSKVRRRLEARETKA